MSVIAGRGKPVIHLCPCRGPAPESRFELLTGVRRCGAARCAAMSGDRVGAHIPSDHARWVGALARGLAAARRGGVPSFKAGARSSKMMVSSPSSWSAHTPGRPTKRTPHQPSCASCALAAVSRRPPARGGGLARVSCLAASSRAPCRGRGCLHISTWQTALQYRSTSCAGSRQW